MRCARLVVLALVLLTLSAGVGVALLGVAPPAVADVATFRLQWGSVDTFTLPKWSSASTNVTLEDWTAPDGSGTGVHLSGPTGSSEDRFGGQFNLYFRCGAGNPAPCTVASNFSFPYEGTLELWRDYPNPGDASFSLDVDWQGHSSGRLIGVGAKQAAPPPPPPGPTVTITSPTSGQTLSGSKAIAITAAGFASGTLRYYISVDGGQKWYWVTNSTSITQWWNTTSVASGPHTISVRVIDSASRSVTSPTVNVTVRN
jgi:hypothetical protein